MTPLDVRRILWSCGVAASLAGAACGLQNNGGHSGDSAPTTAADPSATTTVTDSQTATSIDTATSATTGGPTSASSGSWESSGIDATASESTGATAPCEERTPPECGNEGLCSPFLVQNITREGDVCTFGEPFYVCANRHPSGGCTATPGCVPCARQLYYRPAAQGIDIGNTCSPEPPSPGYAFCKSGSASDADPPECACLCELAEDCQPEPGTSSG